MPDTSFSPGGLVLPEHPLVIVLTDGEPVLKPHQVAEWMERQGLTRDWLREHGITSRTEGDDGL
jgi:hypothetical protein